MVACVLFSGPSAVWQLYPHLVSEWVKHGAAAISWPLTVNVRTCRHASVTTTSANNLWTSTHTSYECERRKRLSRRAESIPCTVYLICLQEFFVIRMPCPSVQQSKCRQYWLLASSVVCMVLAEIVETCQLFSSWLVFACFTVEAGRV